MVSGTPIQKNERNSVLQEMATSKSDGETFLHDAHEDTSVERHANWLRLQKPMKASWTFWERMIGDPVEEHTYTVQDFLSVCSEAQQRNEEKVQETEERI